MYIDKDEYPHIRTLLDFNTRKLLNVLAFVGLKHVQRLGVLGIEQLFGLPFLSTYFHTRPSDCNDVNWMPVSLICAIGGQTQGENTAEKHGAIIQWLYQYNIERPGQYPMV